jgi:hypothetical protein
VKTPARRSKASLRPVTARDHRRRAGFVMFATPGTSNKTPAAQRCSELI